MPASLTPLSRLTAFCYLLLDNWTPPGAVRECIRMAADRDEHEVYADAHVAGMAGRLARSLLVLAGVEHDPDDEAAPATERLTVTVDLTPADVSYGALVDWSETIVAQVAQEVRSTLVERMRDHRTAGHVPAEWRAALGAEDV